MKLLNLNKKFFLIFFIFLISTSLFSEESVDIWNKDNLNKKKLSNDNKSKPFEKQTSKIKINTKIKKEIEINSSKYELNTKLIYGIFEPEENNLTLSMWSGSEGTRVKDTIERINKIKLSSYAEEIFINTLFTISELPQQNMKEEEFINYKLDWLINNQRDDLISIFLNKNKEFPNKKKLIRYLVDKNIAKANIYGACEKITLIDNDVKDSYLDQFKIICLIKNNKKNEAMLMYDLLKEQNFSNKFFDNKIKYLLGLNVKKDKIINDNSLLNFYLSSITSLEFNYKPNKKTKKQIWQYLFAANLLKFDDFENNEKIKELEIAANKNNLEKLYILEVYKNIKFSFNDLLNADVVYQSLDSVNARALVYQKVLLSDNIETKLKYLFLLNDLFIKNKLSNIFKEYLSEELKTLDANKISLEYQTLVAENIIYEKKSKLGKIKYSDKSYHTSKVIKYYVEKNLTKKNTEKELQKVHKKLKKNKKYEISLNDVILLDSLQSDGLSIPKEINYDELSKNNLPPAELLNLVKNKEIGLVLLKIVELIGEDELSDLDAQTIYFINYLFDKAGLIKLRNKILSTVLPDRTEI